MSQIHHLQLSGVSCNGCVKKIRHALQEQDDAATLEVVLPAGYARLETDLSEQAVVEKIEGLGYGAEPLPPQQSSLQVEGIRCNGCVNKVRRVLHEQDPEGEVDADLDKKELHFRSHLTQEQLQSLLASLDYPSRPVESQTHQLHVEGVRCNGCVNKIRRSLEEEDADAEVEADLDNKVLHVKSSLDQEAIIARLAALDYTAEPLDQQRAAETATDEKVEQVADAASSAMPEAPSTEENGVQPAAETMAARPETPTLQLSLTGMTCAGCVRSVEKALKRVEGVEEVNINFGSRTALVSGDVDAEALEVSVAEAGYGASVVEDADQAAEEKDRIERQEYRLRVRNTLLALGLGLPMMVYGFVAGMTIATPAERLGWGLAGLLTFAVLATAGRHFFVGAWKSFRFHSANMDTLIAIGTGSAWAYSMVVVLLPDLLPSSARGLYFEAAAMIIGLVNLGQALEIRARGRTNQALRRLLDLQVKTARVLRDGEEVDIPVEAVQIGDRLRVRPGEKLAVDGEVVEGRSLVDESMLTGEPMSVNKQPGDPVSAGTLNRAGTLIYRATRIGRDTALAQIVDLVRRAQATKPPISQLADQVAAIFVPSVLIIAVITALVWFNVGPEPRAVYMLVTAVTVLIIACPCALGLATPISTMIGIGKAAEYGILVRNGEALQQASGLTTIVLDKTGTITQGRPEVTDFATTSGVDKDAILDLLYALESGSEHPLAEAVCEYTGRRRQGLGVEDFEALGGRGVRALVEGDAFYLGNGRLMNEQGIDLGAVQDRAESWEAQARTVIYLASAKRLLAIIGIADPIKEDAVDAIKRLHGEGIKVMMLTGDNAATAKAVAEATGIDSYRAELLPEDKLAVVKELQASGERVGMSGDGINDAPALSQAEVGFAIGTGTDVAIESADVTLMRGSLHGLADAIELSRATLRNIKQNLWGAFIYNSLGIPIAAGVLFPATGMLLSPVIAGVAMSLSSVTVVSNANRLRLFRAGDRSQPKPATEVA